MSIQELITESQNWKQLSKKINDLTISISEMSTSMKQMIEEIRSQGGRLEELESRDGEMWRKVVGHVITCVAGIVISYLFFQIGM